MTAIAPSPIVSRPSPPMIDPELLTEQLRSIRAQTHRDWVCVISDDCSTAAGASVIAGAVGDDPRFLVSRSPRRLGFYRNFERALAVRPHQKRYVPLSFRWIE